MQNSFRAQLTQPATMLVVQDVNNSLKFYCDKLGFDLKSLADGIALVTLGGMWLYLVTESQPTPDKPTVTLAKLNTPGRTSVNLIFHVADCHTTYETLRKIGVNFFTPPQQPSWGGWRCFAQDPDGYLIEIVTEDID
jgi:catechol 2,3-dioxygenase-like lactoylglutathione lyase family enzyme